jgi:hypothetical protein
VCQWLLYSFIYTMNFKFATTLSNATTSSWQRQARIAASESDSIILLVDMPRLAVTNLLLGVQVIMTRPGPRITAKWPTMTRAGMAALAA